MCTISDELLFDYFIQKLLESSPSSPLYQRIVKKGTVINGIEIISMRALNAEYYLIEYIKRGNENDSTKID